MAYLIYAKQQKYIKILKSILSKAHYVVMETELPEYIIVMRDPAAHIPKEIKPHIQITEIFDYKRFLKGFDSFTEMIMPGKQFKEGDAVKIIRGTYEGFTGVIRKVNEKNLEVEVSVFGRIIKDIFEFDEVEKVVSIF